MFSPTKVGGPFYDPIRNKVFHVGDPSTGPTPPAAPNLNDSYQAGIDAQVNALPRINGINAASQMGGVYADGRILTPQQYQAALDAGQTFSSVSDFRGGGEADVNSQLAMRQLQDSPQQTQMMLDLQRQFGGQFAQQARDELQITDPTGFALRDQFGKQLATGSNSTEGLMSGLQAPQYETIKGYGPRQKMLGGGYASYGQNGMQTGGNMQDPHSFGRGGGSGSGNMNALLSRFASLMQPTRSPNGGGLQGRAVDATGAPIVPPSVPQPTPGGSLVLDKAGNPMATTNVASSNQGGGVTGNPMPPQIADETGMPLPPALDKDGNPMTPTSTPTTGLQTPDEMSQLKKLTGGQDGGLTTGLETPEEMGAVGKDGKPLTATKGATSDQGGGMTTGLETPLEMQQAGQLDATGAPTSQQGQQDTGSQGLPEWLQQLLQGGMGGGDSNNGMDGVPTMQDDPQTAAMRRSLEGQTQDQLDLTNGGRMDPSLQRFAEQAARARGASSGNLMGDGAALQESLTVQQTQQARADQNRANALNLLQSGQTTAGAENAYGQQNFNNQAQVVSQNNDASNQAYNQAMQAIGQRNQTAQNSFGAQQGLAQQRMGARQQDTANTQSFLGLQPIVSQGSQLSGLQSGAAPFGMGYNGYTPQGVSQAGGQMGAEWAGQLYGVQNAQYAGQQQAGAARSAGNTQAMASVASAAIPIIIAI